MNPVGEVLRNTASVCPVCFRPVAASVVEREGTVFLEKRCAEHGAFSLLLSRHPAYYRELAGFYFPLFPESLPQRDYIVHLTDLCGLHCPICLASANSGRGGEYSMEQLRAFLKGKRGFKIDLMGAEPTMREDLPGIIALVRATGNIPVLHTNGIRIADPEYLARLKKAGLRGVDFQFDGLDDSVYERIRGRALLDVKKRALVNLEKANIAVDLIVTVVRGINEEEISRVLEFGLSLSNVKGIFYLGCRFLGRARSLSPGLCYMPDELIDIAERGTGGLISRHAVLDFQKLYFSLLAAFGVRKCFYIHQFLLVRGKNGPLPADKMLDMKALMRGVERFRRLRRSHSRFASFYLTCSLLAAIVLNPRVLFWLREGAAYCLWRLNLSGLRPGSVVIGFISSCDAYSFDSTIARNCGKGTVSCAAGVDDSGAASNIRADRARCEK